MKNFLADIYSIKKYGIEKWHNEFYWPITIDENRSIARDLDSLLKKNHLNVSNELSDSLWVLYSRLVVSLSRVISNLIILNKLEDNEYTLSSKEYLRLIKIHGKPIPKEPLIKDKAKDLMRNIYYNFYKNKSIKSLYKNPIISTESPNMDMKEYAINNNAKVFFVSKTFFYTSKKKIPSQLKNEIEIFVDDYFKSVLEKVKKYTLNQKFIDNIKTSLVSELVQTSENILIYRNRIKSFRKNTKFLVLSVGDIFIRSVSVAMLREGHDVVAFPHGNNIGMSSDFINPCILTGISNGLVCPNKLSQKLYDKGIDSYLRPYGKKVKTEILNVNTYYSKLYDKYKKSKIPHLVKNIMIIEDPLNPNFQPWPFYLDFNIRKAKLIQNNNYNLILKRHPDRLNESQNVYDGYYDQIIDEPFEEVYNKADLFIIPDIGTTTFGFAMFTKKPIIIFSHILENIWPEAKDIIEKRCIVVKSFYEKNGKINFDGKQLIHALKRAPSPPNEEFLKLFLDSDKII